MQSAHSHRATSNPNFLPVGMAIPVPMKIILHRPQATSASLAASPSLNAPHTAEDKFSLIHFLHIILLLDSFVAKVCVCEGLLLSTHPGKQQAGCWHWQPWMLCVWWCPCVVVTWPVTLALHLGSVQTSAFSWAVLARGYQYTPMEEEWALFSSPEPWRRLREGALETSGLLWAAPWAPVPMLPLWHWSFWPGGNLCSSNAAQAQWMMGTRWASAKAA